MSSLMQADRDALLARMEEIEKRMYGPREQRLPTEELRALNREYERIKAEYYGGLPAIAVSRCPLCAEITLMAVDVFGLDGPWWDVLSPPGPGDAACAHRLVTLGAVDFDERTLERAALQCTGEIQPGPAVSFVVPRLMALPGMMCVLYSTEQAVASSAAYFMTYFADPPALGEAGHQPWPRTQYYYRDSEGHTLWNTRNDLRDFDLAPWFERAPPQLAWVAAGDDDMVLRWDPPRQCPYVDLPGRRWPISIRQGRVYDLPLPDGKPVDAEDIFD